MVRDAARSASSGRTRHKRAAASRLTTRTCVGYTDVRLIMGRLTSGATPRAAHQRESPRGARRDLGGGGGPLPVDDADCPSSPSSSSFSTASSLFTHTEETVELAARGFYERSEPRIGGQAERAATKERSLRAEVESKERIGGSPPYPPTTCSLDSIRAPADPASDAFMWLRAAGAEVGSLGAVTGTYEPPGSAGPLPAPRSVTSGPRGSDSAVAARRLATSCARASRSSSPWRAEIHCWFSAKTAALGAREMGACAGLCCCLETQTRIEALR